ncbi:DUF1129 domain-containing protein [Streptococcus sciuri]|uniref:DUF1129 family protein n=1 Tax=Streptococcus sciuri TaxID=2973939 RepID=A0ABT2F723_9STRE|nr:DUF1129 family protein [Streptococcus sciuri]MCS4488197.1 DUF1129 family protein [Streptococcus sciuri]
MNTERFSQLTKKNQEFIHIAVKQLTQDGKTKEEIDAICDDIVPSILEHQEKGIPARNFLGAPTVWASSFTPKENQKQQESRKNTNPWLMWLDTSLLFIGIIALINGLLILFNSKTSNSGIFSILSVGFGGGGAMYATYHFVYRHLGKPKEERPGWIKSTAMIALTIFVWIALITVINSFIPASLNSNLPYWALFTISLASFGLRYYMQKKYNVQNSLAPTQHLK